MSIEELIKRVDGTLKALELVVEDLALNSIINPIHAEG